MPQRFDHQATLYEDAAPVHRGNPLFCHQEFLEKMEENRANTVGRRAALLLHRLLVDVRRQYYKPTQGDNRGWRRSPLGGNHGNHFYAWWAPRGAAPLAINREFAAAAGGLHLPARYPASRRSPAIKPAVVGAELPCHRGAGTAPGRLRSGALDHGAGPFRTMHGKKSASSRASPARGKPPRCGMPPTWPGGNRSSTSPIRRNWRRWRATISISSPPATSASTW